MQRDARTRRVALSRPGTRPAFIDVHQSLHATGRYSRRLSVVVGLPHSYRTNDDRMILDSLRRNPLARDIGAVLALKLVLLLLLWAAFFRVPPEPPATDIARVVAGTPPE